MPVDNDSEFDPEKTWYSLPCHSDLHFVCQVPDTKCQNYELPMSYEDTKILKQPTTGL